MKVKHCIAKKGGNSKIGFPEQFKLNVYMYIGTVHYPKFYSVVTENPLDCRQIIRKMMHHNCAFVFSLHVYVYELCG